MAQTNAGNEAKGLSDSLVASVAAGARSVVSLSARRWPTSALVWSAEGTLLAASHAVEREERLSVQLGDGTVRAATLVGRDPSLDLAVLKVEGEPLTPARWAEAHEVQVGQLVLGLYAPDAQVRARLGVVEGKEEAFHTALGGQVDATLSVDVSTRRLSALALADVEGRFIGWYVAGGPREGLVLPAATLRRVVEQLLKHGRVRRGYLGIGSQPVRLPTAAAQATGSATGLLVTAVEPQSPADRAGLSLGDVVLALDGKPVEDVATLFAALGGDTVDQSVTLKLLRTGKVVELPLTVGQRS